MALTKQEIAEGIALKKRMSELAKKSGDPEVQRADKAYHERLKKFASAQGADDIVTIMGGDT